MHPVAPKASKLCRALADAGMEIDHCGVRQQRLERDDVALIDGALRQHHDINTAGLIYRGEEHPVD